MRRKGVWSAGCAIGLIVAAAIGASRQIEPEVVETRTVALKQTVTLADIPSGSKSVKLWVPVPSDGAWQRVTERRVTAPAGWRLEPQPEGRGDFVYVEVTNPKESSASVTVECTVETRGVYFPLETSSPTGEIQASLFKNELDLRAPLMEVDAQVKELADKVCGDERDPAKQAMILQKAVADMADHYSKDASKPKCGRGAACDCLAQGGGCCTDMHSLFIAMARSRGLPARIQYGYRVLDAKAGKPYDPGYRCWAEYFIPGAGWVPTDVVAADNTDAANPHRWGSLSAERVWLWAGRSFELSPKSASGPVHTMICGWAEIDGKPVDVLPAADGSPSKLSRSIEFTLIGSDRKTDAPRLPQ